jgi:hypothetical protein
MAAFLWNPENSLILISNPLNSGSCHVSVIHVKEIEQIAKDKVQSLEMGNISDKIRIMS